VARRRGGHGGPDRGALLLIRSRSLGALGRPEEGLAAVAEAVAVARRAVVADPGRARYDLLDVLGEYERQLAALGRPAEAAQVRAEAADVGRAIDAARGD
jgi:hypothetical protein